MTFKRVVSIGAHSLDAELMGGPLLIKYAKEGAHVSCLHVTQGRLEDPNATEEQKQAYLNSLLDQNRRAAEVLGGDVVIGKGSIIGGSVWLTSSVPPYSIIYNTAKSI